MDGGFVMTGHKRLVGRLARKIKKALIKQEQQFSLSFGFVYNDGGHITGFAHSCYGEPYFTPMCIVARRYYTSTIFRTASND